MKKFYQTQRTEQYSRIPNPQKPILKFGYPKISDEEDDDEEDDDNMENVMAAMTIQKKPFDIISNELYNTDYKNRIIVINEQIDARCFTYAKMIENWNRMDRKAVDLREKFKALLKIDPNIGIFLGLIEVDSQKEAQKKFEELSEKIPVIPSLFATLQEIKIPSTDILNYEPTPIKIKFNSPGGWMQAYQTLSDVITLSKTKVIGINMGTAYSAAAFLLISCHERLALPKSRILVHRGSGGNFGSFEQTESSQQNYKEQVDEMILAFKKRTKIPSKVLKKNTNPDWYLSANMALKYGMIDRIVTDINEII